MKSIKKSTLKAYTELPEKFKVMDIINLTRKYYGKYVMDGTVLRRLRELREDFILDYCYVNNSYVKIRKNIAVICYNMSDFLSHEKNSEKKYFQIRNMNDIQNLKLYIGGHKLDGIEIAKRGSENVISSFLLEKCEELL